jgi:hypothetical protein
MRASQAIPEWRDDVMCGSMISGHHRRDQFPGTRLSTHGASEVGTNDGGVGMPTITP